MLKFSIITVAFNSEKTIRDTFDSVLAQTYANIEYLVIDGNSTDNTVAIIKEYEPKFNGRMRWVSEQDNGLYDAMNKGIKLATGDVVGIINSDDFYNGNDVIEKIASAFCNKIQVSFGDVHFVNPSNLAKTVRYYSSRNFTPARFRFGFMPAHPSFFTYKLNFERFGYYKTNYKIAADFELLMRFMYKNKLSYKYLPLDVITMRTGGASTASIKSNIILNNEIVRACKENGIYTNFPLVILKYFIKIWELIIVIK